MHSRRVELDRVGGPEVMRLTATELPPPRGNQVLLRQTVIGFNFIDIYHRSGRYPLPLPTPLGVEAVGVVAGVGEAVSTLRVGDRVIYKMSLGAYAEHRLIDADEAVSLDRKSVEKGKSVTVRVDPGGRRNN